MRSVNETAIRKYYIDLQKTALTIPTKYLAY